jgi:hypothetical protein
MVLMMMMSKNIVVVVVAIITQNCWVVPPLQETLTRLTSLLYLYFHGTLQSGGGKNTRTHIGVQ